MKDYHVLSMDSPYGITTDHGVALHIKDVPWAVRQMWAPDAAYKNGKYYFYFPAKRYDGIFQIGVAVGDSPTGPFIQNRKPFKTVIQLTLLFSVMMIVSSICTLAVYGVASYNRTEIIYIIQKMQSLCQMNRH